MPERTDRLVAELTRGLRPVRRVPRLRSASVVVLSLWALVAAAGLAADGVRPDLLDAVLLSRGFVAVFAGLGLVAVGGLTAALALAVPGRQWTAGVGFAVAALGLGLAAGLGTVLVLTATTPGADASITRDLACLRRACLVALLPAVAVVAFVGRAAASRPGAAVLAAALGSAALGAVTTQLSCPHAGARHVITAHAFAPAIGALILALPLLWSLRRVQRAGASAAR